MIRRLTLALAIALLVVFAQPAQAIVSSTATFLDLGDEGVLTITAAPGTYFNVLAEQQDGSYLPVWSGGVTYLGSAQHLLADMGPTGNGQAQFIIRLTGPNGPEVLMIEDPGEKWFWE